MLDPHNGHDPGLVVNPIEHPERAPTGGVKTNQLSPQRCAYPMWLLDQGSGKELDDGDGHRLGELIGDGACRRAGDDELVVLTGQPRRRSARTASLPRTASPAASAASASASSVMARASERMSSVSSSDARSSGLTRTAAGRPLRVTTTRSW